MENKNKLIIAVDFDGTCVDHRYPLVGQDTPFCKEVLCNLTSKGHKLILWTMRSNDRPDYSSPLEDAVNWFKVRQIPLYGINENPDQKDWTQSPKAYANIYIDDLALGVPLTQPQGYIRPCVDWLKVEQLLILKGVL